MTKPVKATKAAKRTTSKAPATTKEIKSWLRGILEFQNDEWVPTKEQWETIRDRIFSLEEIEPQYVGSNNASVTYGKDSDYGNGYVVPVSPTPDSEVGYQEYVGPKQPVRPSASALSSPAAMAAHSETVDTGHISPPAFAVNGEGIVSIKGQDGINSSFR